MPGGRPFEFEPRIPDVVQAIAPVFRETVDEQFADARWRSGGQERQVGLASIVDHANLAGIPAPSLFVGLSNPAPVGPSPLSGSRVLRLRTDPTSLTFNAASTIVVQPGGVAHLDAGTQAGTVVASYVWRKNGVALLDGGNISGATTDDLVIDPVTEQDKAIYECAVTTACSFGIFGPLLLDVPAVDPCPTDTNGDHTIDFLDLNGILSFYGMACP